MSMCIGWTIEETVDVNDVIHFLKTKGKQWDAINCIPRIILFRQKINDEFMKHIQDLGIIVLDDMPKFELDNAFYGKVELLRDIDTWYKMNQKSFTIPEGEQLAEKHSTRMFVDKCPSTLNDDEKIPEKRIIKCLNTKYEIEAYKDFLKDYPNNAPRLLIIRNRSNKTDVDFFISYGVEHVVYVNTIKEGLDVVIKFLSETLSDESILSTGELYSFVYSR